MPISAGLVISLTFWDFGSDTTNHNTSIETKSPVTSACKDIVGVQNDSCDRSQCVPLPSSNSDNFLHYLPGHYKSNLRILAPRELLRIFGDPNMEISKLSLFIS